MSSSRGITGTEEQLSPSSTRNGPVPFPTAEQFFEELKRLDQDGNPRAMVAWSNAHYDRLVDEFSAEQSESVAALMTWASRLVAGWDGDDA